MSKISISIVTYNNESIIQRCLESLLEFSPSDASIVVVDNVSTDRTAEVVQSLASRNPERIRFIQNDRNAGYGGGHNLAIRQVRSDYHLICNPDIFLISPIFPEMVEYFEKNPQIGMVCPRVLHEDRSLQPLNKRHPTVADLFVRRFVPARFRKPFQKRIDRYEMKDIGYDQITEVPFVSGCFMFCRTSVLQQVGGFDEIYFLYFEDCDLSRKFQQAGFRTVYLPSVSVIHLWKRAAHKSLKYAFIFAQNGARYFNKWGWKLR